jgi:hypothetical protein
MTRAPACSKCHFALPAEFLNVEVLQACPGCGAEVSGEIFPAFFRPIAKGSVGEALLVDSHASCFYHPQKQAAEVCASCGRFVCSLCDVELEGQHLCPPCLETAQKTGKIKSLESRRVLHDTIALHVALLSILIFYVSFITAPLALYWAVKHRNDPPGLLRTGRVRRICAMILSSILILGWIALIIGLIVSRR